MTKPTWEECAELGMSATEAANARGVTKGAASNAAKRLGLKFRDARRDAANAERMRERHKDPKFAAAHAESMRKLQKDPEFNPLVLLSERERQDYDTLKRNGATRNEAFASIGRHDLIKGACK